jgi:hypothetical protein
MIYSFFRDKKYRALFFRTIGIAIIAAFILLFRMIGRHGHLDETMLFLFIVIVVLCLILALYFIENRYKNSLQKKK